MKFNLAVLAATTLALTQQVAATSVTWDSVYDNGDNSLDIVACSNGANGVETKYGWELFEDVSTFPYMGGAEAVAGWNDPDCGTCWELQYQPPSSAVRTITVLAIDHAAIGFNIAKEAMNDLTDGRAEEAGIVSGVTATQLPLSECGL